MTHWEFQGGMWVWPGAALALVLLWLGWRHLHRSANRGRILALEILRLLAVIVILVTLMRPERVQTYERERQPRVVVLTDGSRSMETRDQVAPGEQEGLVGRGEWIDQVLESNVIAPLRPRYQLTVERFAEDAAVTDLSSPLAELPERYDNLEAVILLSDGDWNAGESPAGAATRLAVNGVRLFTIGIGSSDYLPDLVLDQVKPPSYSLLGEHVSIPYRVQNRLPREVRTELLVQEEGRVATRKNLVIPPGGSSQGAILWHAARLGEQELKVTLPVDPSEIDPLNNEHAFRLTVRQERLRVLIVESRPRWEYRFLRNALSRDPGIELECLLLHPLLPPGEGADYIQSFPEGREQLASYDTIFLGDIGIGEGELTLRQAELLAGVVQQLGSGLVFLPGSRGRQLTLADSALGPLLPILYDEKNPRGFGTELAANLELTNDGADHLLTMLARTPAINRRLWSQLPGFYWCAPVVRTRPGAQVLAVHSVMRNRWGRLPLLVTRAHGQGNVLFMGTDSAWRWRKGVEDVYHYRFWGQVVRWMAHPRHLAQEEGIRLVFSPEMPRQGETVMLHASLLDQAGFPLGNARLSADITAREGGQTRVLLQPEPGGWGVYTGRFDAQAAGVHDIVVEAAEVDRRLATTIEITPYARERTGQPANHAILRELARITGGAFATAQRASDVVDQVRLLPESEPLQVRFMLWSQWWWGLLLLLLLAAYWSLRKLSGLA